MQCQNPICQKDFEISVEERKSLEGFDVDPDDICLCSHCREQRRFAFRNERNLYKRKCDESDKDIFSVYRPDAPVKVWDKEIWWSDNFDALQYGRDFDFSRPFFEQFYELMLAVPRPSVIQTKNQNADYANDANDNRGCYHVFATDNSINCHYGSFIECRDCIDCEDVLQCELCINSVYCDTSFNLVDCSFASGCSNCYFSSNLVNCHNCIFCVGLQNKKYCIFNVEVGPDVYETFLLQRQLHRRKYYESAKKLFYAYLETNAQRYMFLLKTQNSTGDRLINCQDCSNSYLLDNAVNCTNCFYGIDIKDCLDCTIAYYGVQKSYELNTVLYGGYNFAGMFSNHVTSSFYFDQCYSSQDLFGCVGVRNKKYCIFNKQFSKEEYEEQKNKIITHMRKTKEWGQFFPIWMSPFNYNDSLANIWFPLAEDQFNEVHEYHSNTWKPGTAIEKNWYKESLDEFSNEKNIPEDSLIGKSNKQILSDIYFCSVSGTPYRIIPQELVIYQKLKIALPSKCFIERYKERIKKYQKRYLNQRECQQCQEKLETCFPEEDPRVILCEKCYREYINAGL